MMSLEPSEHVEAVRRGYDMGARRYAENWPEPHPWLAEAREQFLSRITPGGRLVDIGCGPGQDAAYWSAQGLKVLGIDISPQMIEIAGKSHPGIDFRVLAINELESLGMTFDYIWLSYVLLHVPVSEMRAGFEVLHRCLRKDGLLFLVTPLNSVTETHIAPIAGLIKEDGEEITVPATRITAANLKQLVAGLFEEQWAKAIESESLPGRISYSGVLTKVLKGKV